MTRRLVVSVQDLSPSDVMAVKVFLRFVGQTDGFAWELSEQEEGDLRLIGWDDQTWPAQLDEPDAPPVVPVVDDAQHSPWRDGPCLARPLQMESFAELLRKRERRLTEVTRPNRPALGTAYADTLPAPLDDLPVPARESSSRAPVAHAEASTPTPAATQPAAAERATDRAAAPDTGDSATRTLSGRSLPSPARLAELAANAPAPAPVVVPVEFQGLSYRLLRWPSAEQMRGQPNLTRVLGFLAHRPMSLEKLVVHSGLPVEKCCELVIFLEVLQLVERRAEGAPAGQAVTLPAQGATVASTDLVAATAESPASHEPARSPIALSPVSSDAGEASARSAGQRMSGLFSRLRLRLGL